MQLRQLINELPTVSVEGSLDREVTGITYDSRQVAPGMIFVAFPGHNVDGHDFIDSAIDRGATAVICERSSFVSTQAAKIKVADVREALALAAAAYYQHPSTKLKMIGVTGTNGKTTVAFMVKHILETAGVKTGLMGTIRYEVGERIIPAQRTTPEALEVQQMLAHMVRANCEACVMEVSSHALDQQRVCGVDFDVAIFTNLTQDHLDFHGTMENYFQAKKKLFMPQFLGAKRGGSVINIDDAIGRELASDSKAEVQLTYGLQETAKLRASEIHLGKDVTRMVVETPDFNLPCSLPLIGRHNVYNALAAVGAGIVLGVGAKSLKTALTTMKPVPGHLENVSSGSSIGVYVDYANTENALRNVLATLREITSGRLLLTFGCGGSCDQGKRFKMGQAAAELADFTIITSANPERESRAKIANQIEKGFRTVRQTEYQVELDRHRAIHELISLAHAGDIVLILGKSHETYQEFEDTVVPFDDRVYARVVLDALQTSMPVSAVTSEGWSVSSSAVTPSKQRATTILANSEDGTLDSQQLTSEDVTSIEESHRPAQWLTRMLRLYYATNGLTQVPDHENPISEEFRQRCRSKVAQALVKAHTTP